MLSHKVNSQRNEILVKGKIRQVDAHLNIPLITVAKLFSNQFIGVNLVTNDFVHNTCVSSSDFWAYIVGS